MTAEQTAEQYMESLYGEDPQLKRVKEGIAASGMRDISIEPGYGRLLTLLVGITGAKQVMEIGALGGYSGMCLVRGLPEEGRLVSLELNPDFAAVARRHLEEAGYGDRVEYRIGEALDSLKQLEEEGRRFDLFFIDADKGNYPNYLEWAIRLANPGALIVGDNLLMRGKTTNPEEKGNGVTRMREFNQMIAQDPRLEGVLLPAYDGLALARVK
ncbi:O-methyltransferase [Paenibacillus mucilaginosus]|uniref:O-methyltransferase n=3 Tax=Paenibacillus mucilaginosus TaxID=61624 RepID=H6NJ18_9BACL|nr:O-methyltransferase [Paenibacillus mucilaginosus]AEI40132.1 O-methyltransferase [Paenibacillus mucilaginosus KNP414]AFC28780.1 O-methyltransferase [Paenibacillus mucilaginosus 3016]AFH60956.1 O-methyltransferase [Paenibacillus mucilaginosus K02]MCG7215734.1 O-methyltransferase [Paenibacillus mucilaginosus]WDM29365.1 O-methyltransferase [Paenibacillus mucilaginosus]